jgi:hypothetical protein
MTGDRVRTKLSRARIAFDSGSLLYVNHWTTLALHEEARPPGLSMVAGEVYVETVPADRGFAVETPHGRAVDLGTRLGVDVERFGTKVLVVEGRARASTEKGTVELDPGREVVLARRTAPPGPVREARDLERRLAWADGLRGIVRERLLLADDFERPARTRALFERRLEGRVEHVLDGSLCLELEPSEGDTDYLAGSPEWTDYTVTARVKVMSGERWSAALWGFWEGPMLNYRVRIQPGSVCLYKRDPVGGGRQNLIASPRPDLAPGAWYRLKLRLENRDDHVRLAGKIWPDAEEEPAGWTLRYEDRTAEIARRGRVGFYVQRGTVRFDDFRATTNGVGGKAGP